jgi:methionyl-tRNA formyltransferase
MRMILLGTGPFAVPTCQRLLADGHDIRLVVTRPVADPNAKKQPPRPVHSWASAAGLEIYEPASINTPEAIERLAGLQADLLFVCDYGQILSNDCLRTTRLGGINLHGSLLPRHRGAAPVQWTLLSGDTEAGVTVIHMTAGLDAGPALAVARTPIASDETSEQLEPRLAELGVAATLEAIELLANWDSTSPIGSIQDRSLVTKAPRFAKSDGQLDFRDTAVQLERQVRACQPWPSTFAELAWPEGKQMRLLIKAARATSAAIPALQDAPAGTVAVVSANELGEELRQGRSWAPPWQRMLGVATGAGTLLIAHVGPAGKRDMSVDDFLRGHPISPTAQFQLPTTTP